MPVAAKQLTCVLVVVCGLGAVSPAHAGWNPWNSVKKSAGAAVEEGGRRLAKGAVEAIQPALTKTIDYTEAATHRVLDHVETSVDRQVDHAKGAASELLSQTRAEVRDTVDQVDGALERRLLQIDRLANGAIKQIDKTVKNTLAEADNILRERSDQLGGIIGASIAQADHAVEQRIDQIDEVTGRRLGNVDVLATKQRLAIEETLLRVAVLIGFLVFFVFVLRTLWKQYAAWSVEEDRLKQQQQGREGMAWAKGVASSIAVPLLAQIAAAILAGGALWVAYRIVPLSARRESEALVQRYRSDLDRSLAQFEFSRVRYYASQLQVLEPHDGPYYEAVVAKAGLMRDVLSRPALLATSDGLGQVLDRVASIDKLLGDRLDPDVLTLKGLVLWHAGGTRGDEHGAASYCARALRIAPHGFALAPLAENYVRLFLAAPYLPEEPVLGRSSESLASLHEILAATTIDERDFPLAHIIALDDRIAKLDEVISEAYPAMLDAHARSVKPGAKPEEIAQAQSDRTRQAGCVVNAWEEFDAAIQEIPSLADNTAVLAVFRLDDSTFSRAKWFVEQPGATTFAKPLAGIANLELRRKLAPPRIRWEARYRSLTEERLRGVVAFQEAERFRSFEDHVREFDDAYLAYKLADAKTTPPDVRLAAALGAARMDFYVGRGTSRMPLAKRILGSTDVGKEGLQRVSNALMKGDVRFL